MTYILHNSVKYLTLTSVLIHSALSDTPTEERWNFSGNIKLGYVNYDYNNPPPADATINKGHTDSRGIYLIPKLSLSSPSYKNTSFKMTLAGATDGNLNDEKYESRNFVFDSQERKPFVILQEFHLHYKDDIHDLILGRYELQTPLIEHDNYYMLADSYETLSYTNTQLKNYTFYLGYIYAMSGVWDSGANGTEFHSISDTSFVDARDKVNAGNSGVSYAALQYATQHHKIKVWEYYIQDLYNMFLAQYDFEKKTQNISYNLAFQFTNYKEVGELASHNYTNIDYSIYSVKLDAKFSNGFEIATGATKFSDGDGIGDTLSAWGGFPTFTYGYIYNWFETGSLQNSKLYKIQLAYNLEKIGIKKGWIGYRYTYYDLDPNYSYSLSNRSQESMQLQGIRLKYTPKKEFYCIINFEHRTLSAEPNSSAYRIIGGYKF